MKRFFLTGLVGAGCLLPLMGCVVAPAPGPPVAVAPAPVFAPVVVAPAPVVVARPGYWRWYHGRRVWWRRGPDWRRWHRY
jgi:hypothetical protein